MHPGAQAGQSRPRGRRRLARGSARVRQLVPLLAAPSSLHRNPRRRRRALRDEDPVGAGPPAVHRVAWATKKGRVIGAVVPSLTSSIIAILDDSPRKRGGAAVTDVLADPRIDTRGLPRVQKCRIWHSIWTVSSWTASPSGRRCAAPGPGARRAVAARSPVGPDGHEHTGRGPEDGRPVRTRAAVVARRVHPAPGRPTLTCRPGCSASPSPPERSATANRLPTCSGRRCNGSTPRPSVRWRSRTRPTGCGRLTPPGSPDRHSPPGLPADRRRPPRPVPPGRPRRRSH